VDLSESEQLQDLLWLGGKLVDTEKIQSETLQKRLRTSATEVGETYPLILMAKATFGCPSTKKLPAFLASLLALTRASSAALYSLKYFSALALAATLAVFLSALAWTLLSLTA
jgi:hypothetical protein